MRPETAWAVGQPGRDPRQQRHRICGRVRAYPPHSRTAGNPAVSRGVEPAIQVEEYIEGREFALEGLMTHGELEVLAIFDKPDPLEGPFFEETIYVTPSREPDDAAGNRRDDPKAVRALGLRHGPVHAEMRVNAVGVYMLEVAARPIGGLCARALRFEGGLTLEEVVILHAVGKMPEPRSSPRRLSAS